MTRPSLRASREQVEQLLQETPGSVLLAAATQDNPCALCVGGAAVLRAAAARVYYLCPAHGEEITQDLEASGQLLSVAEVQAEQVAQTATRGPIDDPDYGCL